MKRDEDSELACAVDRLACSIGKLADELRSQNGQQAILNRIAQMETKIMSAISEYMDSVTKSFDEIDSGLASLQTSVNGVSDDVAHLKEVIDKLQNNPGPISPEDQKLLTDAQTRANGLAVKVGGLKTALEALDAATERPTPPTEPA